MVFFRKAPMNFSQDFWLTSVCLLIFIASAASSSSSAFYHHVGCYRDREDRALPERLADVSSVEQCYQLVKEKGYQAFGVQYSKECWSGDNANRRYSIYGTAKNCMNGTGGTWSNDVYIITPTVIRFPIIKCYVLEFSFRYDHGPFKFSLNMTGMEAVAEIKSVFENLTDSEQMCRNITFDNYGNTLNETATTITIGSSLRLTANDSVSLSRVNSLLVDCFTAIKVSLVRNVGPRLFGHNMNGENVTIRPHVSQLERIKSCCGAKPPPCCSVGSEMSGGSYCACSRGFFLKVTQNESLCEKCGQNKYQDQVGSDYCKACPKGKSTCGRTGLTSRDNCTAVCPKPSLKCPPEMTTTNKIRIIWGSTAAGTIADQKCGNGLKNSFAKRLCYSNGTWGDVDMSQCYNRTADVKTCKSEITYSDSGTELRWDETEARITAQIRCPGSNKLQASRSCYQNGTWSQVKLLNCPKPVSDKCPQNATTTAVGTIIWPPTNVKKTSTQECPYGPQNAKASRKCSNNGTWGEANTGRCNDEPAQSKEIKELVQESVTKENAKRMAAAMKNITAKYNPKDFNGKDIETMADLLEGVLNVTDSLDEETGRDVAFIFDKCLEVNKSALDSKSSQKMVKSIEKLAQNLPIPPDKDSQTIRTTNLIINTNKIDVHSTEDPTVSFLKGPSSSGQSGKDIHETFKLPLQLIQKLATLGEKQRKLGTVLYTTSTFFSSQGLVNKDSNISSFLNSRVMSASISGIKVQNLTEPVAMTFDALREDLRGVPECVFWDLNALGGKGDWSEKGCRHAKGLDSGRITCQCNHMTNFAVLFSPHGVENTRDHGPNTIALSIISFVGCGISLVGLFFTLLTYSLFRNLRKTDAQKILISLCVALMLLMTVFIVGTAFDMGRTGCRVTAVLLHYSMLAVVMWMAVEGYQMYLAFIQVLSTYQRNFMVKSSIVGWGVPALIVIPTVSAATNFYGNGGICVLTGIPFYAAMFAPTILIIAVNFVIFFFVMWSLGRVGQMVSAEKRSTSYQRCCTAIAIMLLLGLSWVFGALALALSFDSTSEHSKRAHLAFEYLFCIFNSFQGLFIFLFHCVRHKEVWSQWGAFLSGRGLSYHSSRSYQRSHGIGESSEGKVRAVVGKLFTTSKTSGTEIPDDSSVNGTPKCEKTRWYSSPPVEKTREHISLHPNGAFEGSTAEENDKQDSRSLNACENKQIDADFENSEDFERDGKMDVGTDIELESKPSNNKLGSLRS